MVGREWEGWLYIEGHQRVGVVGSTAIPSIDSIVRGGRIYSFIGFIICLLFSRLFRMDEAKNKEGGGGGVELHIRPFSLRSSLSYPRYSVNPHQWRTIDVVVLSKYIFLSSWHSRRRFFICDFDQSVPLFRFSFLLFFFFFFFGESETDSVCLTMMDGDRGDASLSRIDGVGYGSRMWPIRLFGLQTGWV